MLKVGLINVLMAIYKLLVTQIIANQSVVLRVAVRLYCGLLIAIMYFDLTGL